MSLYYNAIAVTLDGMANQLLGRDAQQKQLASCWEAAQHGEPQLVVLWGRRRVGKTFLLSHFVHGRRAVFFGATQQAEAVELRRFYEAIQRDLGAGMADLAGGGFVDWEAALRFVAAVAAREPLVVVLDEVPYLTRSTPGFASIVQVVWDHLRPETRLMLVLTGSAVGTMQTILGPSGALRGRPTLARRLDPFDALEAQVFLPNLTPGAYLEAYAACGGYPLHLRAWDETSSTDANLLRLAGTSGGILLEDAQSILREELPNVDGYARILAAIGRGRTSRSEIADEAAQRVDHPLDVLIHSGFVRKSVPLGAPIRSRPIYEIADIYLAFWFAAIYSEVTYVAAGQGHAALQRRRDEWQKHLGWVFEELARDHARRLVASGALPADIVIGRWWSTSGPSVELDVLGMRGSRSVLLGEARWQTRPLGSREVVQLMAKAASLPRPVPEPMLLLWGRSGIDDAARSRGATGYDLAQMLTI
jgi:AAA+ ATPase superfamily predicted ATPase